MPKGPATAGPFLLPKKQLHLDKLGDKWYIISILVFRLTRKRKGVRLEENTRPPRRDVLVQLHRTPAPLLETFKQIYTHTYGLCLLRKWHGGRYQTGRTQRNL